MLGYKGTTKRRYMWGIGFVCSLLFMAITASWAFEGKFAYRLRTFTSEYAGEVRKTEAPVLFWTVAGSGVVFGVAGVIVTGVGLSKVQRDEDKSA